MSQSINISGRLLPLDSPLVMGIINATPDSFYPSSRAATGSAVASRALQMVADGASILDIGAYSTRPGAAEVSPGEEMDRLDFALEALRNVLPDAVVSIDTFRADVARHCAERWHADIINDISGGDLDPDMFGTVADLKIPYVLMHTRGTPADMQQLTDYQDVVAEVIEDLARKQDRLHQLGVCDVIIDPGFGFAKTVDQNFELLARLREFEILDAPILAGLSRKSMIWRLLDISPDEALCGTTALNMAALERGADILRVHDVREAAQCITLHKAMQLNYKAPNNITIIDN